MPKGTIFVEIQTAPEFARYIRAHNPRFFNILCSEPNCKLSYRCCLIPVVAVSRVGNWMTS